ncbi:MAG: 4'-phosphopantetheinyl transferase superfamily protein [Selenomonadaceae bacterium]|nr:4'-phosphopantetheinyl transferase superfamily protein [Selenomonadaceae bacterium]
MEVRSMRLSEIRGKERFLMESVGARRKEKAQRFRHLDDRLRCLAAGYMMQQYLPGFSEERLVFGKDGKPFLEGGAAFSISHGGDYVVLAWDEAAEGVGVDVEPVMEMECYQEILPFYATEDEQKAIGKDARKAVWVWTSKECLYKCVGEGISDVLELPEVLEELVLFQGKSFFLESLEREGHLFSFALMNPHSSSG